MHGNPTLDRPEAVTQNIAKVLAAFVMGLVTVFGGALVYSHLQQEREPVAVAPLARPEQPTPSVELPTLVTVPVPDLLENSIRGEDRKQTTISTASVSPEPSPRNVIVPGQPAETVLPAQPHSSDRHGAENSQPVQQRVPVQGLVAALHASSPPALSQEAKYTPGLERDHADIEQPQRAATEPVSSEPASKAVMVPASAALTVRLSDTLSSDRNRPGDMFRATLVSPLEVDGYLLAEAGATVLGRVVTSRRAPLIGGRSELSVILTGIDTSDGQLTRMETGWRKVKGTRSTLTNTAKMASGATVGAVVGAVTGAAKGAGIAGSALKEDRENSGLIAGPRTAVFPAGAELTFILVAPLTATGTRHR
jgi:hypothetical protein